MIKIHIKNKKILSKNPCLKNLSAIIISLILQKIVKFNLSFALINQLRVNLMLQFLGFL